MNQGTRRVADIPEAFGASNPGSNPGGSAIFKANINHLNAFITHLQLFGISDKEIKTILTRVKRFLKANPYQPNDQRISA